MKTQLTPLLNTYSLTLTLMVIALSGCSPLSLGGDEPEEVTRVVVERQYPSLPEGNVNYIWEEPTREIVDVPPGLDAEQHYYRPGHQEVIETLPGRYQFYSE